MSRIDPFPSAPSVTERAGVCHRQAAGTYVIGAFATIPEDWRRALWYSDMQGLTPAEAGPLLQISPELFSAVLKDARAALRVAFASVPLRAPGAGIVPENGKAQPGLTV